MGGGGREVWRRTWLKAEVGRTKEREVQEAGHRAGGGVGAPEKGRKCLGGLGRHPSERGPWWEV